ncbi:ABC transporter ATP-binding protein [Agromyces aerolatus]|nr:ABC transporter ATP-binding protein [Agromyces sp. LY-1074]
MTRETTSTTPLLEVTDLSVRLPTGPKSDVHAVKRVSFHLNPGERVGIVGESGSGKSVTGRAVAGLLPLSRRVEVAGSIRMSGKEMIGASRRDWQEVRRSRVSMIFQDPLSYLNPTMRVGAQVAEAYRPADASRRGSARQARTARDEIYAYMELAGLKDVDRVARKFPFELSGGMRQRVLIAIALAKRPEIILADEPTTALDVTVQQHVLESLSRSVAELGTSLIMISHDLAVVAEMCERVYVMYAGYNVEDGPTEQVFTNPAKPYTQGLLRSVRSLSDDSDELYSYSASLETAGIGELR